jgi:hypothetical protein
MYVVLEVLLNSEHFSQKIIVNFNVLAIVVEFCVEFCDPYLISPSMVVTVPLMFSLLISLDSLFLFRRLRNYLFDFSPSLYHRVSAFMDKLSPCF